MKTNPENITIEDLKNLFIGLEQGRNSVFMEFAHKLIEGGIYHLPLYDYPKVVSLVQSFFLEYGDLVSMATASIRNHYAGDD